MSPRYRIKITTGFILEKKNNINNYSHSIKVYMALGLDNWNIFYECLNIIFLLHPLFLVSCFPPSLGTIGIADFKSKTTKWISPFYQKLKSNFGKMAIKKQQIDFF